MEIMRKMHKHIWMLFTLVLLTGACRNNDSEPTLNSLLTNRSSKKWILYSQKTNGVEQLAPCERDNEWTFYMNGSIYVSPGVVRCGLYEEDRNDSYSFLFAGPNNDIFYFRYYEQENFFTVRGQILTLTESNFTFRFTIVGAEAATSNTIEYAFKTD